LEKNGGSPGHISVPVQLEKIAVEDESDMVKKTAHIATRIIKWVP
jgi:hypothetical protein